MRAMELPASRRGFCCVTTAAMCIRIIIFDPNLVMKDSVTATYRIKPQKLKDFKHALAEVQNFVCPAAFRAGLKIHRIESIFDEDDPDTAVGFFIEASRAEAVDGETVSGSLFSLEDDLASVTNEARRQLVMREKTQERREATARELSQYAKETEINGKKYELPELPTRDADLPRHETQPAETANFLAIFDIERGRIIIGRDKPKLEESVGEEMREVFRQQDWSSYSDGKMSLEQTRRFLATLERAAQRGRKLLDDPFPPED